MIHFIRRVMSHSFRLKAFIIRFSVMTAVVQGEHDESLTATIDLFFSFQGNLSNRKVSE